jgi:hypothetical protein
VAASLNTMLDRIAALIANLRQVSADVAHDLRTPLAALRNHLERMKAAPSLPAPRDLDIALARIDEVMALFDAILRISEVEAGSPARGFAAVDLSALVANLPKRCPCWPRIRAAGWRRVAGGLEREGATGNCWRRRSSTWLKTPCATRPRHHHPPCRRCRGRPCAAAHPTTAPASPPPIASVCCAASCGLNRRAPRRATGWASRSSAR